MKTKIFKMMNLGALCLMGVLCASCSSDDDFTGDPAKDWAGTTTFFTPTDETGFSTYYTPAIGRCGDPMPFYDQKAGEFKVLYLQEYINNRSYRFHPIWGVSTTDGCNYQSLGEVLSVGANDYQQDAALGTGCCYYNEKDGLYYIYYTGHNSNAKYTEAIMRATSSDFKTWTRDELWQLNGPDFGYSGVDFRDPQIFVAEDGLYHMVISTRPINGGDPKFAEFKSSDMKMATSWEALKACFNDPGANWPKDGKEGILDSRGFYAGKTASNGTDRLIWGWCPFRSGSDIHDMNTNVGAGDGNEPNWSGALVCHKIIQHSDGTLTVGEVPAMAGKYNQAQNVNVMASNGYALTTTSR